MSTNIKTIRKKQVEFKLTHIFLKLESNFCSKLCFGIENDDYINCNLFFIIKVCQNKIYLSIFKVQNYLVKFLLLHMWHNKSVLTF